MTSPSETDAAINKAVEIWSEVLRDDLMENPHWRWSGTYTRGFVRRVLAIGMKIQEEVHHEAD